MQHRGARRVGIASASDNTSSSRRACSSRSAAGGRSGRGPASMSQLAAACGDEPAQRAERRVAAAVFVRRHDGLRRARPAREVGLGHPVPATDGHEELGGRHRASISLCLCSPKPVPDRESPRRARRETLRRCAPNTARVRRSPRSALASTTRSSTATATSSSTCRSCATSSSRSPARRSPSASTSSSTADGSRSSSRSNSAARWR